MPHVSRFPYRRTDRALHPAHTIPPETFDDAGGDPSWARTLHIDRLLAAPQPHEPGEQWARRVSGHVTYTLRPLHPGLGALHAAVMDEHFPPPTHPHVEVAKAYVHERQRLMEAHAPVRPHPTGQQLLDQYREKKWREKMEMHRSVVRNQMGQLREGLQKMQTTVGLSIPCGGRSAPPSLACIFPRPVAKSGGQGMLWRLTCPDSKSDRPICRPFRKKTKGLILGPCTERGLSKRKGGTLAVQTPRARALGTKPRETPKESKKTTVRLQQ